MSASTSAEKFATSADLAVQWAASAMPSDVGTMVELAMKFIAGEKRARDFKTARTLLRHAWRMGHGDAGLILASLTAAGLGGAADWNSALRILKATARISADAASDLALIQQMHLDASGAPSRIFLKEELSAAPAVFKVSGFLTPEECRHVAMSVADIIEPSMVVDPITRKQTHHPIRTSSEAPVGPTRKALPLQAILKRIAQVTETEVSQGEPLTILRYGLGQQYRPHLDALPGEKNQRIMTAILYLNSGFQGGETVFPKLGVRISPKGGDALFFKNVVPDTMIADPSTLHAGLPVTSGFKWIATRWIRQKPFDAF